MALICEMCGVDVPKTRRVLIEGTPLNVCNNCARFGSAIPKEEEARSAPVAVGIRRKSYRPRDVYEKDIDILVTDYPTRIREAREGMGISQEDLGRQLNEKLSVINKLETGDMRPDDKLVAKLERSLGIKLREKLTASKVEKTTTGQALTIGDLIREAKE